MLTEADRAELAVWVCRAPCPGDRDLRQGALRGSAALDQVMRRYSDRADPAAAAFVWI